MLPALAFSESVQSTVANSLVQSCSGQKESSLSVLEQLNGYQSQLASMAEEVAGLKEYYAEVVAVSKRNGDRLMHRGFRKKRGSDEKEQEKKGQTYAERVLNLTEFGDRCTDELERREPSRTQKEEVKMEIK